MSEGSGAALEVIDCTRFARTDLVYQVGLASLSSVAVGLLIYAVVCLFGDGGWRIAAPYVVAMFALVFAAANDPRGVRSAVESVLMMIAGCVPLVFGPRDLATWWLAVALVGLVVLVAGAELRV